MKLRPLHTNDHLYIDTDGDKAWVHNGVISRTDGPSKFPGRREMINRKIIAEIKRLNREVFEIKRNYNG